jgi:pimeloyl-ACP methyl ester carboxylesterase
LEWKEVVMGDQSAGRPSWLPEGLFPFADHYADIDGARVHYVDEGSGPPLLLLHGNPTWSFLYRDIISGLQDRFRCIAPDYPGFGLSDAPPGYGYTPAEHAKVIEALLLRLDLTEVTLMVQDRGGPIGFAVAARQPHRFAAFVIGNTWAWPKSDPGTQTVLSLPRRSDRRLPDSAAQLLRRTDHSPLGQTQKAPRGGDGRLPRPVPYPAIA